MDISPHQEHLLAKQVHQELIAEFKEKLLPHNHPLSRHVRRVVNRILESSDLGSLKDELAPQIDDTFVSGTPGDTWSEVHKAEAGSHGAPLQRDWNVLVVNDENVANAMVDNGADH